MDSTAALCRISAFTPKETKVKFLLYFFTSGFVYDVCVNHLSTLTFPFSDIDSQGGRGDSENQSAAFRPPEYILPGSKDRPLTPLHPLRDDRKVGSAFWTCRM